MSTSIKSGDYVMHSFHKQWGKCRIQINDNECTVTRGFNPLFREVVARLSLSSLARSGWVKACK